MTVIQTNSLADLQHRISNVEANRLFILDFYADWCGPCKFIAPLFAQLAERYPNATFIKINVDFARDVSQHYAVRAMPTFVFVKNKVEVERLQGADPQALERTINRFYDALPTNPNAATSEERFFLNQFVGMADQVRFYQDLVYKTLALSLIPSEKLSDEATVNNKVNSFLLAKALLEWFKNDFFSWCDSPLCNDCGKTTPKESGTQGTPTSDEREMGASRVEVYTCVCGQTVRFPRYNDPVKLLETRTGRCGEWANCFCLIASSMNFDVRFVFDVSDHVWCELWIPEMDRWVHCDPCENRIDAPLLYESGWGKKLSYVIGYGLDHVCDVTWRYSLDHKQTLKRRKSVREPVLANFLVKLSARMAKNASSERLEELKSRRLRELIEFLVVGKRKNLESYGGRTTGAEEWRAARGELGMGSPKKKQIVLRPSDQELAHKLFSLKYNCASDVYTRGETTSKGWASYVFKSKNVMRKSESDWKMAYLCRKDGNCDGEVTWAIDLTGVSSSLARVRVSGAAAFESGVVELIACADNVCMKIPNTGELVIDDLPSALLKITAHFSGGEGENAFQHAQLFRTSHQNAEDQFSIDIELK